MIDLRETSGLPLTLDDTHPRLSLQLDGGLCPGDLGERTLSLDDAYTDEIRPKGDER